MRHTDNKKSFLSFPIFTYFWLILMIHTPTRGGRQEGSSHSANYSNGSLSTNPLVEVESVRCSFQMCTSINQIQGINSLCVSTSLLSPLLHLEPAGDFSSALEPLNFSDNLWNLLLISKSWLGSRVINILTLSYKLFFCNDFKSTKQRG